MNDNDFESEWVQVPWVGYMVVDLADGAQYDIFQEHDTECVTDHGGPTRLWFFEQTAQTDIRYHQLLINGFVEVKKSAVDVGVGALLHEYVEKADLILWYPYDLNGDEMDRLFAIEDKVLDGGLPRGAFACSIGPFPLATNEFPAQDEDEEPSP